MTVFLMLRKWLSQFFVNARDFDERNARLWGFPTSETATSFSGFSPTRPYGARENLGRRLQKH